MEPHRGIFDRTVFDTCNTLREQEVPEKEWLGKVVAAVEDTFDTRVYTHTTRQIVTLQELVHGSVLALRAYLKGDASRFMPPMPGKPNGGRPVQAGYKLFGRSPGPTDFWSDAHRVADTCR